MTQFSRKDGRDLTMEVLLWKFLPIHYGKSTNYSNSCDN